MGENKEIEKSEISENPTSDDEIEAPKPKVKREMTEKQREAFLRAQAKRQENINKRREEKAKEEEHRKKEVEEKIVKKAISIKKKQIKQTKILEKSESESDNDSIEVHRPIKKDFTPRVPSQQPKQPTKPLLPKITFY